MDVHLFTLLTYYTTMRDTSFPYDCLNLNYILLLFLLQPELSYILHRLTESIVYMSRNICRIGTDNRQTIKVISTFHTITSIPKVNQNQNVFIKCN